MEFIKVQTKLVQITCRAKVFNSECAATLQTIGYKAWNIMDGCYFKCSIERVFPFFFALMSKLNEVTDISLHRSGNGRRLISLLPSCLHRLNATAQTGQRAMFFKVQITPY